MAYARLDRLSPNDGHIRAHHSLLYRGELVSRHTGFLCDDQADRVDGSSRFGSVFTHPRHPEIDSNADKDPGSAATYGSVGAGG